MRRDDELLERPLPANPDAERMVLGCIVFTNDLYAEAVAQLSADDFYLRSHQLIFGAMGEMTERGIQINPVTLAESLRASGNLDRVGGQAYLVSLIDGIPRFSNIDSFLRIVAGKSLRRQMIRAGDAVIALGMDDDGEPLDQLNRAQKLVCDLESKDARSEWHESGDIAFRVLAQAEDHAGSGRTLLGLATGFCDFDIMTGGLQRGDLIIIGARPSMGKSAFVGGLATGVAKSPTNHQDGIKPVVAIFTIEMSKEQLVQRMQCAEARIDLHRFRTGQLRKEDWRALGEAAGELDRMKLAISDDSRVTPQTMRARLRQLQRQRERLDLVIVDYLQLMQTDIHYDTAEREVKEISRALKRMAKDFDVPVVAVASLNRNCDSRSDKRPLLSDFRESGSIESDADLAIAIYRDEVYNPNTADQNVAEIIIRKQRNGPIGTVDLVFLKTICKFEDPYTGGR